MRQWVPMEPAMAARRRAMGRQVRAHGVGTQTLAARLRGEPRVANGGNRTHIVPPCCPKRGSPARRGWAGGAQCGGEGRTTPTTPWGERGEAEVRACSAGKQLALASVGQVPIARHKCFTSARLPVSARRVRLWGGGQRRHLRAPAHTPEHRYRVLHVAGGSFKC